MLLNLVRNSREAMEGGGRAHSVHPAEDGAVQVRVEDTGPGDPDGGRCEHLFEPFFSTKEGGTGLGLAVSQQILQAHGGALGCERSGAVGHRLSPPGAIRLRGRGGEQPAAHA